eukprot:CAMPEP_0117755190 /NCGR_PEP_ID=MMETSP0947-20121206/13300_1 /TAXON_ID=44440 /ORGANISM="Chattonella subsalsa, Strain CCMP2191" /LENGTH=224 /DNA_ID=CAMNT_0005574469 /DNA_START=147 /DNA_END=818 /DNA_ORIENTATION=+
MRRRGVGVSAVKKKEKQAKAFGEVGKRVADENFEHIQSLLENFHSNLEDFAQHYKDDIKADPAFRQQFQAMCSNIGVDPLASTKGFWAEILGVGDFYYELAVQITEICIATRESNGGLLGLEELQARLIQKRRKNVQQVTRDDVRRAIQKVKVLGSGYRLIIVGAKEMLLSVPLELSADHSQLLELAQSHQGKFDKNLIQEAFGWDLKRINLAIQVLLREGMVW